MIPDKAALQAMFPLLRDLYPAEQWPSYSIVTHLNDAWTQAMQEDYLSLAHSRWHFLGRGVKMRYRCARK